MHITHEKIQSAIESKYINRGKEIVRDRMIKIEKVTTKSISGIAIGSGLYKIFIQEAGNSIIGKCTCPAYRDFGPCKHMAAVCLAYLQAGYEPDERFEEHKAEFDEMVQALSDLSKEELVGFIVRLASYDPEVMRMVQEQL